MFLVNNKIQAFRGLRQWEILNRWCLWCYQTASNLQSVYQI